jgi:hypothetical protein
LKLESNDSSFSPISPYKTPVAQHGGGEAGLGYTVIISNSIPIPKILFCHMACHFGMAQSIITCHIFLPFVAVPTKLMHS